jgi:hypothetical protein
MTESKSRTFISLAKEYLSLPGESLPQFAAELKKLTDQDRADLRSGFEAMGFSISEPAKV